jgi:hypothetical protein
MVSLFIRMPLILHQIATTLSIKYDTLCGKHALLKIGRDGQSTC